MIFSNSFDSKLKKSLIRFVNNLINYSKARLKFVGITKVDIANEQWSAIGVACIQNN